MRRLLSVFLLVAAMVAVASPASASPPSGVAFEVETSLIAGGGPFVASGPAVDDGLVCDSGETIDVFNKASGFSKNGFNVQVIKQFTCDDGSGDFLVKLQVRIDFRKGVTFHWNVVGDGTGAYEDLHGNGDGVGLELCGADCVFDIYEGGLHSD